MTQTQIARQIGRSQPEVSRLLRFHGTTPLARNLRREAEQIRRIVAHAGGSRLRVFGSVATGQDRPDSDVDLLFVMNEPLSLEHLVIDAICMRMSAGIEALARLDPDARASLSGDDGPLMWGMRNRISSSLTKSAV